jgi:hypothetical protein
MKKRGENFKKLKKKVEKSKTKTKFSTNSILKK